MQAYDYIIVGTGAAGATLADELSKRTERSILILESGGRDTNPWIHIPKGVAFLLGQKRDSFFYDTQPVRNFGKPDRWQRGRVDGGSTSINGMMYERGGPSYWDSVADIANDNWKWKKVLEVFKSIEDHDLGASDTRGAGGPLGILSKREPEELNDVVVAAAKAYGLPWTDDFNEHEGERISFLPNTIKKGLRQNTAQTFLRSALKRKNVTRLNNAHAVRVLFEGKRATGLEVLVNGQIRHFSANTEIILSAGAIETPLLLERSGIGRRDILEKLGVTPVVENQHVGEHAPEQRLFSVQWRLGKQMGYNRKLSSLFGQALSGLQYLLTRKGVIGTSIYDLGAAVKSDPALPTPDIFLSFAQFGLDFAVRGFAVDAKPALMCTGFLFSPTTESSIHASSMDPFAPPTINAGYFEHEWEQRAQHRILEVIRGIAAQDPLAATIIEEQMPGPSVSTVEQVLAHSYASGALFHTVATARMGQKGDAVVDPELRVYGVDGLRVADASVLPRQPGVTMAPSILVGAMAARLITKSRLQVVN